MQDVSGNTERTGTRADRSWKRILIDPKFQLTFLGYTIVVAACTIGIFYTADAYFFWKFRQIGADLKLPADHVFFQFLGEQERSMNIVFLVTSLFAFTALCLGGLIVSHRVAGPLRRLRKHLVDVNEGRAQGEMAFRKDDFFPELAEAINMHLRSSRGSSGSMEDKKAA
jgi:hypothetical protein